MFLGTERNNFRKCHDPCFALHGFSRNAHGLAMPLKPEVSRSIQEKLSEFEVWSMLKSLYKKMSFLYCKTGVALGLSFHLPVFSKSTFERP